MPRLSLRSTILLFYYLGRVILRATWRENQLEPTSQMKVEAEISSQTRLIVQPILLSNRISLAYEELTLKAYQLRHLPFVLENIGKASL